MFHEKVHGIICHYSLIIHMVIMVIFISLMCGITHVQSGGSAWVALLECRTQKEPSLQGGHTCDILYFYLPPMKF